MTIKEQISLKKVLFRFAISEEREERNKLPIVVLFSFQLGFVVTVVVVVPISAKLLQQGSSSAFQFTFALTRGSIPRGLEEKTANQPSVHQT